jgi:hypothetical protein
MRVGSLASSAALVAPAILIPSPGAKFLITPSKFCSAVAEIVLRSSSSERRCRM